MAARSQGRARRLVRLRQQLDVRPLHGRRSQRASVAMAKLQSATATASLCWNQVFFCWIQLFVLLQPLFCLLPSPFDLMNNFFFLLEPVPRVAGTSWCMCYKVDASPEEATSSGEECCIQRRSMSGAATVHAGAATGYWGSYKRGGCFLPMHFFCRTNFFVFAGTDVFFCWNRDNFLLHRFAELSDAQLVFAGT